MTIEKLNQFRDVNTRQVEMPDGTKRLVRMTPTLWDDLEFIRLLENIQEPEVATFALEEMELQEVSFDRAFRGVVAHFANRWSKAQ